MLFVFYCFVLTVLASLIPEGQGNCRSLKFTSFHKLGFRLENHTVRTIGVVNEDLCMFQCYLEPNCVSYNFCEIKQSSGKHKCDLNNATIEHDEDLVQNESCSYRGAENACKQNPCKNNATCQAGFTERDYQCLCVNGSGFKGHNCDEDIDECLSGKHSCEGNTTCNNTIGSYCCRCKKGYQRNKTNCTDIDECLNGTHGCDVNAECNNTLGSYKCTCKDGFQGNGTKCTDLDECMIGTHDCDVNTNCNYTLRSHNCTFKDGIQGNGTNCTHTNECTEGKHDCDVNAECNNTLGSYKCTCKDGYERNGTNCTEKLWSVIICEGGNGTISCDNDRRTIDVVDANYGRLDSNTCHHSKVSNTNCKAANSLFIVRLKCNEKASCELYAASSVFGHDPCKDIYKYLEVKYKCVNLASNRYESIGCFKDNTTSPAIETLEGKDDILDGNYSTRNDSIDKCFRAAERQRFHIFAVQDGGRCQAGASAIKTFHKYNQPSQKCPSGGKGGKQINHVYYIKGHKSVGCYESPGMSRLTHDMTRSDPILNGIYPAQPGSFISKCAVAVIRAGYWLFAVENNDSCSANATTPQKIKKLEESKKCGLEDANAFQFYTIKDLRCHGTLGMESGAITDEQISFSSEKHNKKIVRLHHTGKTWIADKKDSNQWLQVDLRAQNTEVTRVATQGSDQHKKWVKKYKLQYSNYRVRFQNYTEQGQTVSKEFDGNTDKNNVVYHDLNPPITARYIRFLPVEWEDEISMRVELYGCVKEPEFKAVFTNLGSTAAGGPSSIGSHYTGQDHDGQVTVSSGIQSWTVPYSGEYRIEAIGGAGWYGKNSVVQNGGRGAKLIGNFILTKDEIVRILVGHKGKRGPNSKTTSGGGGGTFVVRGSNTPLIIAGGGGGIKNMSEQHSGCDASISTTGNAGYSSSLGSEGTGGNGGGSAGGGGGGGGFHGNGRGGGKGGKGFLNGGKGGTYNGGFGGGGGNPAYSGGAGGGGGYSGGAGGVNEDPSCGGGGGSFNSGTNQENECCYNTAGNGRVTITLIE
ncbi:uncharacterized protein [Pocillopora verrucosa]|uniref:uncharacterized protein n=1 Tax=Pocillopora verrucosa TaxID=203993 RepID=UPI003342D982